MRHDKGGKDQDEHFFHIFLFITLFLKNISAQVLNEDSCCIGRLNL